MASPVAVVDSGILIASVFKEDITPQAEAVLAYWEHHDTQLHAPTLFRYEVVAVAQRPHFQKRTDLVDAIDARDFMLSYSIQMHHDDALLKRAFELATELNRPTGYDSQYLAVAERLDCEFWTADERLFNAVKDKLAWVKWVGNFEENEDITAT